MKRCIATLLGLALASAGFSAPAGVLYDNLGAVSAGADPVASFGPLADSFSTGAQAVTVDAITVLIEGDPGGSGVTDFALLADNDTAPGAVIAETQIPDSATAATLTPLPGYAYISLSPNTRYWIELSSADNSSVNWSYSYDTTGVGVAGEYFANTNGVFANTGGPYQMQVSYAEAVPEPAAWSLMLVGFGGLGALVRRRSARAARA